MEAVLQFTGGSGSATKGAVPVQWREAEPNPWLDELVATLGARQELIFEDFVSDWLRAIRSSVSLGSIGVSSGYPKSVVGQETNHSAALRALDAALANGNSDDAKTWEVVKSELQKDRTSSRKLFK
jgi:hypothetical protein